MVSKSEEIIEYVARNIKIKCKRTWRCDYFVDCTIFIKKEVTLELAKSVVEKFVKNKKEKFQSITFKKLFQTIFNWI
jgi:chromosomal replication initiator protein